VGDDMVGGYFSAGAEGFTSSISNFMPDVAVALFNAASSGDFATVREITAKKVQDFYDLRIRRKGYEVSMVKEAMELLGRRAGPVRPPLVNVTAEDRERLRAALERAGLRLSAATQR
ncbi:MAG: dihydrodipicolinate synthase family protein, partial [Chloroflexi bacterium]|nr:dihydrodipicolinate synthase family protein [Chloroflexota bacterium]